MGFVFGMLVGGALFSGSSVAPPALGSIPFRCLAAFEISEAEYRDCRTLTLRREIYEGTPCRANEMEGVAGVCSFHRHITWEIAALRELKKAVETRKQQP
jgi:hypothetical protein